MLRAVPQRARAEETPERSWPDPSDRRPAIIATVVAAALSVAYLVAPLTGQDTSAQLAHADFARAHPLTPVDLRWFGGTLQFGYSLWAPWVAGWVGTKLLGAITAILGTWLATRLIQRARPVRPIWGGVAVAVCQVTDAAVGRTTYQCGLVCALAAALAVLSRRSRWAFLLALLAGAASPVATLGLWIYAATALVRRRVADALILAIGSGVSTAVVALVFADGATMTFATESLIRATLACLVVIAVLPRRQNTIRIGATINLAVVLGSAAVASPVGSNAERLSLLFAIPIVAAFVEWRAWMAAGAVAIAVFVQPPTMPDIGRLAGVPATHEAYYGPLIAAIHNRGPLTGRVEVPEVNGHWDAAFLAKHVPIARGWLRQVDTELNRDVFFNHAPTTTAYRAWLTRNAVQYVAVPDARFTTWGRRENALIASGLSYLRPVWRDGHWTLYVVQDASKIVSAPARLVSMDATKLVIEAAKGQTDLIRIRWFRWTTLHGPAGSCIVESNGQVMLHTGAGQGTARYVISSSVDPRQTGSDRGHCD